MRKALVIILCVTAFCLSACQKEKPNARFVGTYGGEPTATGTVMLNGEKFTDFENQPLPEMTMVISAGDKPDRVTATCIMEGETQVVGGTVDGNTINFDPTTLTVKMTDMGNLELEATANLCAMLSGPNLVLGGTVVSEGEIEIVVPMPYKVEGTISGTLVEKGI